jgi:4a-hydroxytetrahydrobiopterin dehydratase
MPVVAPLPEAELKTWLAAHPTWSVEAAMLVRTFEAATFPAAIDFVARVGKVAEAADHHPDIDVRWRKVTLRFVTHDAGNRISALDVKLAAECDGLFASR